MYITAKNIIQIAATVHDHVFILVLYVMYRYLLFFFNNMVNHSFIYIYLLRASYVAGSVLGTQHWMRSSKDTALAIVFFIINKSCYKLGKSIVMC